MKHNFQNNIILNDKIKKYIKYKTLFNKQYFMSMTAMI